MIITLGKSQSSFIQCYKAQFDLTIENKFPVGCADCKTRLNPGEAINRRQYRRNGYICLSCFASHLTVSTFVLSGDTDLGFIVNAYDQIQACTLSARTFTTPEVIDAVHLALLKKNPSFKWEPAKVITQAGPAKGERAALVARMTIRKPGKPITTIEIRADVGFHNFYTWFTGQGRARKQVRISQRSYGQGPSLRSPAGLEVIAAKHYQNEEVVKITILKKKIYQKLISCSGDQLPGYVPVIVRAVLEPIAAWKRRGAPIALPASLSIRNQNSEIPS